MCKILRQIKKDVPRTSSTFSNENFDLPMSTGKNPVFNILSAYAEQDQELGYTQGMNFIAAILYVAVQDEVLAFSIMQRLMQSKQQAHQIEAQLRANNIRQAKNLAQQCEWRFVFTDQMPKLNAFIKDIKKWLQETKRILYIHFQSRQIVLEALLSSPFLSLFSNLIPNQHALKVLDRFIHFGQKAMIDIVKNILKNQ